VNGGAIAIGHPLAATGARLTLTALYELRRRNQRYGVASMCIGGGQGIAAIVENLN
jgi:acetyl-CoA acetyltransferase